MTLELEEFNEIYKLFEDGEKGIMAVGQINATTEDGRIMKDVIVSFKLENERIFYTENIGSAYIPNETLNKEIFDKQKEGFEKLNKMTEKRKAEIIKELSDKGFTIIKGVFVE